MVISYNSPIIFKVYFEIKNTISTNDFLGNSSSNVNITCKRKCDEGKVCIKHYHFTKSTKKKYYYSCEDTGMFSFWGSLYLNFKIIFLKLQYR